MTNGLKCNVTHYAQNMGMQIRMRDYMDKKSRSPVKAISIMMIITLLGKISGLLRDRMLTLNYGTGMEANAFLTASRIPRVFFDAVFASAIAASFIPVFNEYMVKKGKEEAFRFSGNFITVIGLISAGLTALGMVFAPQITQLFAGGFNEETAALCASLTRIMFPTVIFTGLAFSFVGILQSLDEFNIPAAISLISNGIIIAYFLIFNNKFGIYGLAVTFLIAWFMQAAVQVPSLRKRGYRFTPSLNFKSEGMKKVFLLMLPVMVSTWVTPINQTVNARFGSSLFDGAGVSAIELAYNLYTIIVGVFILSITNYIFPRLSKLSADKNSTAVRDTISQTMHVSLYIVLPMTAGLMVMSRPVVDFIYGGGKFDAFSIDITSRALTFLCLGMVGYAMQSVFTRAFFAEQSGRTPLIAGAVSIAVNIALSFLLVGRFDIAGLGVASAASCTVNGVYLLISLERKKIRILDRDFVVDMIKAAVCALIMAVCVYFASGIVSAHFGKLISLVAPVAVGITIYFVLTLVFGLWESKTVIKFIKEKVMGR